MDRPIDPNTGKPKERRDMGDFEREMLVLMGEVRQYMANQPGRCASHSASIAAIKASTDDIKLAIEYKAEPTDENPNIGSRTGKLESMTGLVYTGLCLAWSAILGIGGWIYIHATSNAEPLQHGAEAIKRMKGGG